jgi:hypothetical protein
MSRDGHDKKFWAGVACVFGSFALYGLHLKSGHTLSLYDLLFHAMPFTLGFALMVPKMFPGLMVTVQALFGKWRSQP